MTEVLLQKKIYAKAAEPPKPKELNPTQSITYLTSQLTWESDSISRFVNRTNNNIHKSKVIEVVEQENSGQEPRLFC
ncbi:MAG: hypothetical protein JO297_19450 [Nitrososphaeraceae archaeon]|nr:hypothetical protein [Nitrososphaeraceae archaeon]